RMSVVVFIFLDILFYPFFLVLNFFFSSRRRHTRFSRDWSSDVCASDLNHVAVREGITGDSKELTETYIRDVASHLAPEVLDEDRSEERRVGKQWRSWQARRGWTKKTEKRLKQQLPSLNKRHK